MVKIKPATKQSLAQATPTIKQLLQSQSSQTSQTALDAQVRKDWLPKTKCRTAYAMNDCKGYKPPKNSASSAAAAAAAAAGASGAAGCRRGPGTAGSGARRDDRRLRDDRRPRDDRLHDSVTRRGADSRVSAADPEDRPDGRTLEAVAELDAITRRLRRDCPWDREQDERSIVPHTLEEAYELADAAVRGDDARMLDELGDVLFQVHFLSLLLSERGAGDLAAVAEHCTQKLIRRHPHVFGETEADTAAEVLRNWEKIKQSEPGREPGIFGEVPENLPGPLYARKVQRRAANTGFDFPGVEPALEALREEVSELDRRRRAARSCSTSSATCCSQPSTSPASSGSTRSSRSAPRPAGSAPGSARPPSSPHREAEAGTISTPTSSSRSTPPPIQEEPTRNEPDRARTRQADPRQPRQPDGRGGAEPPLGRLGTGRGAVGRLDRRVRGRRAARRRLRLARQGRGPRGRQRQR